MKVLDNTDTCQSLKNCLAEKIETSTALIREKPWPSVAWALLAGYILHALPLCRIAGAFIKIALVLLKPLALLWLIGKIWEKATTQRQALVTENPPQEL